MHIAIEEAILKLRSAERQLALAIKEVILSCKHTTVGECRYETNQHIASVPPRRVCFNCGITEEGWGIGYYVLARINADAISREQVNNIKKVLLTDADKNALWKLDLTLEQLLTNKLRN